MVEADLGRNLEDYMDRLVKTGRYQTRDDVLREGLRLLEIRERRREELDAAIDRGLADVEAGRVTPLEEVAARLERKYLGMIKEGNR